MGWGQWWSYTEGVVVHDPDRLGVYELGDGSKNTVYYGRGKIKTRLLDHLNKRECPMARYYRFELFDTEAECEAREKALLEEYRRLHGKLPTYNERIS